MNLFKYFGLKLISYKIIIYIYIEWWLMKIVIRYKLYIIFLIDIAKIVQLLRGQKKVYICIYFCFFPFLSKKKKRKRNLLQYTNPMIGGATESASEDSG